MEQPKINRFVVGYWMLMCNYECLPYLKFEQRIGEAKRLTIKQITNTCTCNACIDLAYHIHELNFYIND